MYIYIYLYIYIKFSCPKNNTGSLIRGQPHSLNVYHNNITSSNKGLSGVS